MNEYDSAEEMNADRYKDLKPLSFYWVKPCFDVDMEGSHEELLKAWQNNEQPALYKGNGNFVLLGIDEDDYWPVIWVGDEIKS